VKSGGWSGETPLFFQFNVETKLHVAAASHAQRVDDLLCAVLYLFGDSASESGGIHPVPGSDVDGAAGAKHDDGGVGMPERLPLAAARPRCEVLPVISRTDQDGRRESASIASKEPESELVCGTLGEVGQRALKRTCAR
jgi:hypothetical protein